MTLLPCGSTLRFDSLNTIALIHCLKYFLLFQKFNKSIQF
jgi:hypothetical protein